MCAIAVTKAQHKYDMKSHQRQAISHIYNRPGPWFNIKMTSYQYRKSHRGDKTILRLSYLHNGISYTGKMTSLYWIRAQLCGDCPHFRAWCGWPLYITFLSYACITVCIMKLLVSYTNISILQFNYFADQYYLFIISLPMLRSSW